jgi:helicase
MRIADLLQYGLPPGLIRLWEERESDTLLPLQELAVKRHALFGEENLLIQAPTSSGKTFVGELAAIRTALQGKKVIYLVPLKALAEEKFLEFREKYSSYGLKVIISTRDYRSYDDVLESGDFSLAVVVYEKLAQLLVRRPERLEEIRLIIADELELLSDPDRGAQVELLMTRILRSGCRLIGLSAVLGEAEKLAAWMNARLVQYDRRPVELRYGVVHDGSFRYRTYNDLSEGEEALVPIQSESAWEILSENLAAFVERGEPCLVFVKAKHESRRAAELLAGRLNLPAATEAIEELRGLEATHSRDALLATLANGVAFHNADLSPEERRVVEKAFRTGEVLALTATSTLAVGLNMPAQNVFVSSEKWHYDNRFGMPWKTPILRSEFENMGGRAGRYGGSLPFGRAILIAPTPFDAETLWRRYAEGERERIVPQIDREATLEDHVLRLVSSKTCRRQDELLEFFESTLTGRWLWQQLLTKEECDFKVRAAVDRALEDELLDRDAKGNLEPTSFGQAVAAKGITVATALELKHWIRCSAARRWSEIDLILAAAMTADGRMLQVSLTAQEYDRADYPGRLKTLTRDEDIAADVPLNRLRNCNLMPFFEEVRAIKVALFLREWIEQAALYDLEENYRVMAGQILSAAEQVAWLIESAAALASALGAGEEFVGDVRLLGERVQHGMYVDGLRLAHVDRPRLDRNAVLALVAQGFHTPEALAEVEPRLLAQILGDVRAAALQDWARGLLRTDEPRRPKEDRPALILDDRHPNEIILDGQPIRLQEKQFRLLRALAEHPGECVPYETLYQAVWGQTIVESNQMHFQKNQLLRRIASILPDRTELVRTVAKQGFRLDLRPNEVIVNRRPATAA